VLILSRGMWGKQDNPVMVA